jgi:GNAT superfamily N-acetyltransferase
MDGLEIVPATVDRFDDVTRMLNPRGRQYACWCMHWRQVPHEDPAERGEHLRALAAQEPAPGMLAYLEEDGAREVVGWLGFAPRSRASSLQHSRVLPRRDPSEWDTAWAVMCFVVRPGYRRRGIAREMLRAAVDYAREHGATVVEGFPVDAEGRRVDVSRAFVGTTSLFESAGFEIVEPTSASSARLTRWVARRELGADATSG